MDYAAFDLMLADIDLIEFEGLCANEVDVEFARLVDVAHGASIELVGRPAALGRAMHGFGGRPEFGRLQRGARVRARGADAQWVQGLALCSNRSFNADGTPGRRLSVFSGSIVPAGAQRSTYAVAVLVHGLDVWWRYEPPAASDWMIEAKKSERWSTNEQPCSWVILRRADGRRVSADEMACRCRDLLDGLSLGLGYQVSGGPILYLGRGEILTRLGLTTPRRRDGPAVHTGWLHEDSQQEAVRAALNFVAAVLGQWRQADLAFGVAGASSYLVRASHARVLDWQARDLVIGLELLVKKHTGGAGGDIRPQLAALEGAIGLGHVTPDERDRFRRFRNRLSHEGTLRDPGAQGVRRLHQSVGWLRSFALRHAMACVGWRDGRIWDFGSVPHKMRKVTGRRFAQPRYVPPP